MPEEPDELPMPLPLEIHPAEEAMAAVFPDGEPTPETPIGPRSSSAQPCCSGTRTGRRWRT
jgi:hypothetical protein